MTDLNGLKNFMIDTAYGAGDIIMDVYHRQENDILYKADTSPVTEADERAEDFILSALSRAYPDIPVVAEEAVSKGTMPIVSNSEYFFLVDPLDGTKEFIKKRSDFTVNIALIKNAEPISGIVYAPAKQIAWIGINGCAEKITNTTGSPSLQKIQVSDSKNEYKRAVVSLSHNNDETENYLKQFKISERVSAGSSLKFCLIADGQADIYPRFGRTMEWDTAAGDAVLRAAGGITITPDKHPLKYGKTNQNSDTDFANPFFIAGNSFS